MGARNDSLAFDDYFFKFFDNVFFPHLEKNNIKTLFHLGDIVDRRKFVNYVILNRWRSKFFDRLRDMDIEVHAIVGNHDIPYKNTNEINAIDELFSHYKNLHVYRECAEIEVDGLKIALVPWMNPSNYASSVEFMRNTEAEIVFGHFEINGFEVHHGQVFDSGLDRDLFNRFDMVMSGHFHLKSTQGSIFYLGSPYQMTWADYNTERGFHYFDTKTRDLDFVSNPYKMFHRIGYDDITYDMNHYKTIDVEQHRGAYVKVVSVNKTNPYIFETFLDRLYKAEPLDVKVVEDYSTDSSDDQDEDILDQAEDTMTILSKYIENVKDTLNVQDIDALTNIVREIYLDAINMEQI